MFDFFNCEAASWWPIFWVALAALLGYLLKHFLGGTSSKTEDNKVSYSKSSNTDKSALELELQEWKNKYNVAINQQSAGSSEWKTKLQAAEDRASTFQKRADEAEKKLSSIEAEKNDYASRLKSMQAERDQAKSEAGDLVLKLNAAEAKAKDAEAKANSLAADLSSAKNSLAAATSSVAATSVNTDDIDALKAQIANLKQSSDAKDKKIIDLLSKEALAKELQERLSKQNDELEELRKSANRDTSATINENNALKAKIAEMEKDHHRQAENLNEFRNEISAERANYQKKIAELEAQLKEKSAATTTSSAAASSSENTPQVVTSQETVVAKATLTPIGFKQDDLKAVEGIGPKVEGLFHAKGITTWKQLSELSKEQVKEVLESGGTRYQMLNGNSWPKQAELLANGKWDDFKAYTDYLIAGVDPAETNEAELEKAKAKAEAENARIEELKKTLPAGVKWDDLKIVEGIGPVIEGVLHDAGIKTWKALAEMDRDSIKAILDQHGERFTVHEPATWPQQADLANNGKWEELKKLQDELKGGR